jgi:lysophospholipase L1-like esterase
VITPVFLYKQQEAYPWLELHQKIQALCEKLGFQFIDPLPVFLKQDPSRISFDPIHPNRTGHELLARFVYRQLAPELGNQKLSAPK